MQIAGKAASEEVLENFFPGYARRGLLVTTTKLSNAAHRHRQRGRIGAFSDIHLRVWREDNTSQDRVAPAIRYLPTRSSR